MRGLRAKGRGRVPSILGSVEDVRRGMRVVRDGRRRRVLLNMAGLWVSRCLGCWWEVCSLSSCNGCLGKLDGQVMVFLETGCVKK